MNEKYIVYFISRTKQKMINFITEKLAEQNLSDIIPSHGNILTSLYETGEKMSLKEIAKRIKKDKSTVTPLINKLCSLGYIEKEQSSSDKRVTYVSLTEKGYEIQEKYNIISKQVNETAFKNFSDEEKETFLRLLKKMNQNFSK